MKLTTLQHLTFLELEPADAPILTLEDAKDVIGNCLGQRTFVVLLHESQLTPDFFDLSTRFAGEMLQKFQNYRIKAAFIVPNLAEKSEFFVQMAQEETKKRQFGFLPDRPTAEAWLLS
jgi:hypothetical protein